MPGTLPGITTHHSKGVLNAFGPALYKSHVYHNPTESSTSLGTDADVSAPDHHSLAQLPKLGVW